MKVLSIVGARPQFIKAAPVGKALRAAGHTEVLVHTGQHYDFALNERLFADLNLPQPDVNLEVGSGSHAVQTAEVMKRFEPLLDEHAPSCVVVVGDVNSTLACSLVAAKREVPVAHVEAGLRSFDRSMPEEINRVLTDQIADLLYTTERSALENLTREGIDLARVHFVGNLMIDSLHAALPRAVPPAKTLTAEGHSPALIDKGFGLVTLHRPSNVDAPDALAALLDALAAISRRLPLVWPMHPRTRASIERFGLVEALHASALIGLPPQGYLEMVGLMNAATVVLTDSGGVQEETTALGVPCLTLRDNTERPVTITEGTNTLTGTDTGRIVRAAEASLRDGATNGGARPELWDGKAAERIAEILASRS